MTALAFRKLPLALVFAGLLGIAGWQGRGVYQHWRARESVRQARSFLREGKPAGAVLSIQAGLAFEPGNPEALELAAAIMEAQGNIRAMEFRQRRVAVSPSMASPRIALAESALRFNQVEVAFRSLAGVKEADRMRPEFLSVQAACLAMSGHPGEAAAAYCELLARAPGHELAKAARVNLARLGLGSSDPADHEKARAWLEPLAGDPVYGAESLRMRARLDLEEGNAAEALRLSVQLVDLPKTGLEDRLLLLDALIASRSPLSDAGLRWLEQSVVGNPDAESDLAGWILRNRGALVAVEWLASLPAPEQARMPVPVVMSDCYAALKDWTGLENLLTGKNWGKLEAQRLGLLADAGWGRGDDRSAAWAWGEALNNTRHQTVSAIVLARMAVAGGHMAEACDALWRIPVTDPNFPEAQNQLFAYYLKQKDAGNLLRVLEQALTTRPEDIDLKRSIAALLLIGERQIPRAARLARNVYRAAPKPIANAAVYAYSLLVSGDAAGADQVFQERTEAEKLSDSAVSYYVLILSARGRVDDARRYARHMNREVLFPEMVAKVRAAEAAWGPAP